jgi:hypothetical protein
VGLTIDMPSLWKECQYPLEGVALLDIWFVDSMTLFDRKLPLPLQNPEFLFLCLEKKQKRPIKGKSWKKNVFHHNAPQIQGWLVVGGNIGIACLNGLVVIDIEDVERVGELCCLSQLPPTFTVRTGREGGKGRHLYYFWPSLESPHFFEDPDRKNPKKPEEPLHLGEIRCGWQFAVCPPSIHPSGNVYEVIEDVPIARIEA